MKILLAGEYSSLHNQLKEGLLRLGHEVDIVSSGDFFKNYPRDFDIRPKISGLPIISLIRKGIYKFTKHDIARWETHYRIKKLLPRLKNYDIVQLINIYPFETPVFREMDILETLFAQNQKSFVLACGDDYITNSYYLNTPMRYNIFTPYKENPALKKEFLYSLKYLTPPFKALHHLVERNVKAFIPTDLDYAIPYKNFYKATSMIPNPVNTDKIAYQFESPKDKITVFHGINTWNYIKKGNKYFSQALGEIQKKFPGRVEIIETRNLPYVEYIRHLQKAHIVLDQVYAYDQGYNALISMAMGKVVFTGAEKEFTEYYRLKNPVCINAVPDVQKITEQLEDLIMHPDKLVEISRNARRFIETEHHYIKIAEKYVATWNRF